MKWLAFNWIKLFAIALLIGALFSVPYFAYYQFTNWVAVIAALITAQQAHVNGRAVFMWLFIFTAVIFNPIAPFHFRTDVWQIADIVVVLLFIISFFFIKQKAE